MTFEVTILGSNSAIPANDRHPTSQVLNVNGSLYLIDCGEATQIQLSRYRVKRGRIDNIFISHLHGDHYFGLIGLITSFHLNRRVKPLHIYGPKGLEDIITLQLEYSKTALVYELIFHALEGKAGEEIFEDEHITVTVLEMTHRIPCSGFLFREKQKLPNIIADKIEEYKIPYEKIEDIKQGNDYVTPAGKVISHSELTIPPPPRRSYVFATDTLYNEALLPLIQGVDMLYHEATFSESSLGRAKETFHSTAIQAATIAKKAGAGKLLIGHFSAKYKDLTPLLEEAKTIFENTHLALEGLTFEVPQF